MYRIECRMLSTFYEAVGDSTYYEDCDYATLKITSSCRIL